MSRGSVSGATCPGEVFDRRLVELSLYFAIHSFGAGAGRARRRFSESWASRPLLSHHRSLGRRRFLGQIFEKFGCLHDFDTWKLGLDHATVSQNRVNVSGQEDLTLIEDCHAQMARIHGVEAEITQGIKDL